MEVFYCKFCKYYTIKISHFKRHLESKSHLNLSSDTTDNTINIKEYKKKIYCCDNCDAFYVTNKSLKSHKLTCQNQSPEFLKEKINTLEKQLEDKNSQLKTNKKQLNANRKQLDKIIDIARENSKTASASMNMLKFANKYLYDAEPFEELKGNDIFEVIKYDNPKGRENINEQYVQTVIHKFNNGIFANFIGNMIIEYYKPKTKTEANFIATDTSRLCFIIMQKVKDKNKTEKKEWINDKSGAKFTELVLNPLMTAIVEILVDYYNFKKNKEHTEYLFQQMNLCLKLKRDINVDKFIKPILKHVAPSFHFDKLKFLDDEDSDNLSNDMSDYDSDCSEEIIKPIKTKIKVKKNK